MIVLEILGNLFVQLAFTVGFVMLYGCVISFCNRCFYDACGDSAFGVVRLTGYVGTPIHEYSHALMCLLFGHSVKKISVFAKSKRSKTLGYVEHTYYRKNLYQQMGNFFIGISPLLAGGGVILLLVRILTPRTFFAMTEQTGLIRATFGQGFSEEALATLFGGIGSMPRLIFSLENLADWRFWICMVLAFSVAIHMEVSRSDIVSGLRGLGVISLMLLVADVVLGLLFPNALAAVTVACVTAGAFMALALLIPSIFSLILGVVSLIVIFIRTSAESFRNDRAVPAVVHHTVPARKTASGSHKPATRKPTAAKSAPKKK